MHKLLVAALALLSCAACHSTPHAPTLPFEAAAASPEHEWLRQLVGEWRVTSEASMGADQPAMKIESTESVRAIGALWVLSEGSARMDGQPFTSLLTLGYDPVQGCFVGTWVDTLQTHLWIYRGTLDRERNTLTLEARGPGFDDPAQSALYRDVIEVVDRDHKRLISSVQGPDGAWTEFLRAESTRVK
jgi:hypothetical protein